MPKPMSKKKDPLKFEVESFGFDKAVRSQPSNLDAAYGGWKRDPTPESR